MNALNKIQISEDTAKLILRLTIGILVLLHGVAKLKNPEVFSFVESVVVNAQLPAFIAYGVYVGEIVAPLMLIFGYKTRLAAGLIAFTLVVAIVLVHAGQILTLGSGGGWAIELQALYLFGSLALFGLGSGKYTLMHFLNTQKSESTAQSV